MPKRNHPDYYYTIRDAVIAKMGPRFDEQEFKQLFPAVARPHNVIPYSDGYPAIRRIIMGLVKTKMRSSSQRVPTVQVPMFR